MEKARQPYFIESTIYPEMFGKMIKKRVNIFKIILLSKFSVTNLSINTSFKNFY